MGLFSIVSRDTRFINTCKDTYFLQYILLVVWIKDIQVYSSTFYIQHHTVCCLSSSVNRGVIASEPGRVSGLSVANQSGAAPSVSHSELQTWAFMLLCWFNNISQRKYFWCLDKISSSLANSCSAWSPFKVVGRNANFIHNKSQQESVICICFTENWQWWMRVSDSVCQPFVHCELYAAHRPPWLSGLCTHRLHLTKAKVKLPQTRGWQRKHSGPNCFKRPCLYSLMCCAPDGHFYYFMSMFYCFVFMFYANSLLSCGLNLG